MKNKEVLISRIMPLVENNLRIELRARELDGKQSKISQDVYEKNLADKKAYFQKMSYKALTGLLGSLKANYKKADI